MDIGLILFLVLLAALIGGIVTKLTKLPTLVGYIVSGLVIGVIFRSFNVGGEADFENMRGLGEIGIILLLFSVGLEVSVKRILKLGKVVLYGSIIQTILTALIFFLAVMSIGLPAKAALVLGVGFALSSTAIIVKLLADRGEKATIHGQIMLGWSLIQDLLIIPFMSFLPVLGSDESNLLNLLGKSLVSIVVAVFLVFFLGRLIVPPVIHKVASLSSRELLTLTAFCIAVGTAFFASTLGISPALGAFLAGVVISESTENHAILSEVRPLRDLFMALFFVTLGFFVLPSDIAANLPIIIGLTIFVILVKAVVNWLVMLGFDYRGKTAISVSIGLAQVSEFAFILFLQAIVLGVINDREAAIGVGVTLISLIATPFLFKGMIPLWRKLKSSPTLGKFFWRGYNAEIDDREFSNHIIICGYGRVGKWIGKSLSTEKVDYIVIDYNRAVVNAARGQGVKAIYGDPAEPEVLKEADIKEARALVLTIPDIISQEEAISFVQTNYPEVKIIVRADLDLEVSVLRAMKIDRVVQPEFEAAVAITRELYRVMGKEPEIIAQKIKSLRLAYAH